MQWLLIRLRKEQGLTQKELADKVGINVSTYVNKETGKSSFKDYEIFKLMKFFGKPFNEIFLPPNCIDTALLDKVHE